MAMAPADGVARAAAYLRKLLVQPGEYRARWQRHATRWQSDGLNQAAIAHVIARHIWETGERDERADLPRELKDRVARSLRGEVLTPVTLRLFIDAFEIQESDAARLWALLGQRRPPAHATAAIDQPRHRTILLHEFRYIGVDGAPREHRTIQVVRACRRTDHYTHFFDSTTTGVELLRGGRAGQVRGVGDGLYRMDISFGRVLRPGDTASLEYRTFFRPGLPYAAEFRRSALRMVENVEIRVQFEPARLPTRIAWTTWRSVDGAAVEREPERLDADHAVHRYMARLEAATVGFTWEW